VSKTAIQPTRKENYPEWYQEVVKAADMAENSPVRGCMVIRPWGYAIWERMQAELDRQFKATGHENAYFPLLIPVKFLEKEAAHVDGFAKECAVVTHHRLKAVDGKLVPDGELEEPFVIRPTSETIIGEMFSKWCQSYRDLPILINQWANVMRWEMRTRMFLRTSEFLWQEGHTVHATKGEAVDETLKMLDIYAEFARDYLAIPVVKGEKTPDERFPGAVNTYTIEAMMQDGKALQSGTSHFLGQNFSKASEIKFQTQAGTEEYAWTTSWGVSTRMVGALVMTHSDDNGLVLPPKIAPKQVVIIPIFKDAETEAKVMAAVEDLNQKLLQKNYAGEPLRVLVDKRDLRGGEKNWYHIKRGVPIKVEIGPRDVDQGTLCVVTRDDEALGKKFIPIAEFVENIETTLSKIHDNLLSKAEKFRDQNTKVCQSLDEVKKFFSSSIGFASVSWCEKAIGHAVCDEFKITPRCIVGAPLAEACVFSGEKATHQVLFAKAY
jgi:prolyl-tRNA synthetase